MRAALLLKRFALFSLALIIATPVISFADEDQAGKPVAIQARKYKLKNELTGAIGFLPLDAFAKGVTIGGSYTYHFNNFLGLELINFHLVRNFDTSLRNDLEQNFGVQPTEFNLVKYLFTSSFVLKPIYRKMIWFNRTVLHGETSFVLGGGVSKFDREYRPTVDLGVMFRIWMSRAWSVRGEARDYLTFNGFQTPKHVLYLGLGLSFSFPW